MRSREQRTRASNWFRSPSTRGAIPRRRSTEYGKKFAADDARWTFLTGDPATLDMLDHDAFKLGNLADMDHSTRFVLIDKKGRVRGYYGLFDGDPVARLKKDAARLEAEKDQG